MLDEHIEGATEEKLRVKTKSKGMEWTNNGPLLMSVTSLYVEGLWRSQEQTKQQEAMGITAIVRSEKHLDINVVPDDRWDQV